MKSRGDTIVAIATAHQNAGIGIIRLSGPAALPLLRRLFVSADGHPFAAFEARYLHFGKIRDQNHLILDEALAVWMPAPHTLTGEDVVELHCHGNVHLLRRVLREILAFSEEFDVRAAEAGEFSKRAFLAGKMDLTQAEAVHDLIQSQSESALQANLANLDGALSRKIAKIRYDLTASLALIEASFEFPEEDIQTYNPNEVLTLLQSTGRELGELMAAYQTSKLYDEGVTVAIVGRPNVGKSSLLNAILREDRAIVTEIAGTTRDVVQASKIIGGLRFIFADTAGLRDTSDVVEQHGIARSHATAARAQIVLQMTDKPDEPFAMASQALPHQTRLRILNKTDLYRSDQLASFRNHFDILICTDNPSDILSLENLLVQSLLDKYVQNSVHVNERQYQKIAHTHTLLERICAQWPNLAATEILAEEIRNVIHALDEITGKISNDAILGEIFKRFCIGK